MRPTRPDAQDVSRVVVDADRRLAEHVRRLAMERLVFVAGIPGTGKSLLVHQIAHLAHAGGRRATLLQWDVARPVFEASRAGQRHPLADGVTHPVIRRAAGLWVRDAIAGWHDRHAGSEHLLIGEVPLVGHRFVELARRIDDRAEPLLAAASCRFVLALPSREVRRALEDERGRRAASPLHPREREDAPPQVLRDLWRSVVEVARQLGPRGGAAAAPDPDSGYDPAIYRRVFEAVLRHRNVEVVALDVVLPTAALSVYDYAVALPDLVPSGADAEAFVAAAERETAAAPGRLEREVSRWWEV